MATTAEAAAIITRNADPHGDGFGIAANVSYSFYGGGFAFSANQQAATLVVLQLWEDVARLNFFVDDEDPEIAFKHYRDPDSAADASVKGSDDFNEDETHILGFNRAQGSGENMSLGQSDFFILIHEMGHAIGFKHPGDYNAGGVNDPPITYANDRAYVEDSYQFTVMSYFGERNTGANFGGLFARTPLLHDIAAAQQFYGANMTTRAGNTVYGFNSNAGDIYLLDNKDEKAVFCIWDAAGIDTLDMSGYDNRQTINLNPGKFSSTGGLKFNVSMADAVDVNGNNSWEAGFDPTRIANLVENAIGGFGDDAIIGNQANNVLDGSVGDDGISGNGGDDTIIGGIGGDRIDGGDGFDRVVYGSIDGETITIEALGKPSQGAWSVTGAGQAGGDSLLGVESFTFGSFDDDITLRDRKGATTLTIDGGGGNDTITGSNGAADVDTLIGGDGRDTISALRGVFHAFGGAMAGLANSWVENLADNDLLIVDRRAFGGDYRFTNVIGSTSLLGTYTGTDGSTARGFARIDYSGSAFADTVYGALGNDLIKGFDGNDSLEGDLGNDQLEGGSGGDSLYGEAGNDVINGGPGFDYMYGGGGNDDITTGGGGSETAWGEDGNDRLFGSADGETLDGGTGNDKLFGEAGNDLLDGGDGNDRLNGGDGNDEIQTGLGVETIDGGAGNDFLVVQREGTTKGVSFFLNGPAGSDGSTAINIETMWYYAGTGNDTVHGGDGNDSLAGDLGNDRLDGGAGSDSLYGEGGNDVINGGQGFDYIYGGSGDDRIETGGGAFETAWGEAGNDVLTGNADTESLDGGAGNDRLIGQASRDVLYGREDDDVLIGGEGNDELNGGTGKDVFRFETALNASGNVDFVVDFTPDDDSFEILGAIFGGLRAGVLDAARFCLGTAAADAGDRIIYDGATGALFFDADGTGAAAQIRFATLYNTAAVTYADFVVI